MPDRHQKNPITFRPAQKDAGWLEEYARMHGMSERSVLGQALAAFRMSKEDEAWNPVELLEMIALIFTVIDAPICAFSDHDRLKRAAYLDDRVREATAVLKWCGEQETGGGLKYVIQYLKERMELMPPPDYHTDYAECIAEERGWTIEAARQYIDALPEWKPKGSATEEIRTEIEQ